MSTPRQLLEHIPTSPDQLAAGEVWTNDCPECGAETQGGIMGLAAHIQVVHAEALAEREARQRAAAKERSRARNRERCQQRRAAARAAGDPVPPARPDPEPASIPAAIPAPARAGRRTRTTPAGQQALF